jgi:hypothetical protein
VPRDSPRTEGRFPRALQPKRGEEVGGISTALRGATEKQAVAFRLGSDDGDEDGELHGIEPFIVIVFRHTHQRDRGPK